MALNITFLPVSFLIMQGVCGSGRCVNKPGGFECYCPFGKLGERCEQDISIYEPAFGDESYIAYPTPRARRWFSVNLNFMPEVSKCLFGVYHKCCITITLLTVFDRNLTALCDLDVLAPIQNQSVIHFLDRQPRFMNLIVCIYLFINAFNVFINYNQDRERF